MPISPCSPSVSRQRRLLLCSIFAGVAIAGCDPSSDTDAPLAPSAPSAPTLAGDAVAEKALATPTVFASGLKFPRGFTWGPDGSLYVAEAGSGGSHSTSPSQCDQVTAPVGPYVNGRTARISRIDAAGHRTTFAGGFPSGLNAFGDVLGVADVAFIGGQLYALSSGGGCSHGVREPTGIARVSAGSYSIVADLSAFQHAHPTAVSNPGDFEPDGSWYSMLAVDGKLFAVEPNHGEVVRIAPGTGKVSRLADISATQGHAVPTVLAQRHGNLYLSFLGTFPVTPRSQRVLQVHRNGDVEVAARGFTTVLGLDFDAQGRLYVLETTHGAGFPTPGTGRVVRLNQDGTRDLIVNHLFLPTAMRFGPDGWLYISNQGFGPPQPGEILRVSVPGVTPAALAQSH